MIRQSNQALDKCLTQSIRGNVISIVLHCIYLQDDINRYFPSNHEDLILYTPNNTNTFRIMENVRYRLEILDESKFIWWMTVLYCQYYELQPRIIDVLFTSPSMTLSPSINLIAFMTWILLLFGSLNGFAPITYLMLSFILFNIFHRVPLATLSRVLIWSNDYY